MGRYFIGNGCYPIFLVWKTGLLETLADIMSDMFRKRAAEAGAPGCVTDATDLASRRLSDGKGPIRSGRK